MNGVDKGMVGVGRDVLSMQECCFLTTLDLSFKPTQMGDTHKETDIVPSSERDEEDRE